MLKTYYVKEPFMHQNQLFQSGAEIELTHQQATSWIACGCISTDKPNTKSKATRKETTNDNN